MSSLAAFLARRSSWVLLAAAVATAAALAGAARLRLETDLVALLPEGSPAAEGYRTYLERFGGFEKVFVMLVADGAVAPGGAAEVSAEGRETALLEAAAVLAGRLAESPEVAAVTTGIEPADERFFLRWSAPRLPLLLGEDWRREVARRLRPEAVAERPARLRAALAAPGGGARAQLLVADPLGFHEALPAFRRGRADLPLDPLTSAFLSADGGAALVVATPASAELDPEAGRRLLASLAAAGAEARAAARAEGVEVEVRSLGGPLYAAHDEALLRRDLEATLVGSLLGCSLLLVAAFESVLLPLVVLLAIAVALVWTGAWVALGLGPVSGVGVGFAAVLVGLGIDYGIHGGARLRAELLAGRPRGEALGEVFRHAGPGILTSALTTAAAFATLSFAHFRPLRELGLVVAVGILAILLASASVGSALATRWAPAPELVDRRRRGGWVWRALGLPVDVALAVALGRPRSVLAAAAALSLVALWGAFQLELDADPRALRPEDHPTFLAEQTLSERFGVGLDTATLVVSGADVTEALERSAAAARLLRAELGAELDLTAPSDWLPAPSVRRARLAELRELPFAAAADHLEEELRAVNLDPRAFAPGLEALRAFGRGEDPGAPPPEAWPPALAELLRTDADGTWAALRLRLAEGTWPEGPPPELVRRVEAVAPGSAFASAPAIGLELRRLADLDFERLELAALAAVSLVVWISFRGRLGAGLLSLLPVALGSLWTLGLWGAAGGSLDLFSLAVLPILLGIGIDDGLHALHGARLDPAAGLAGSLRGAGRAMVLTTLTTCVGFGTLIWTRVPGLRSGGALICGGVAACLLATLVVLPAIEAARKGKVPA